MSPAGALLPSQPEQDVFCLEVGVHDVVGVDEEERLADLHDEDAQFVLVLRHPMDQLLVLDLHRYGLTR